MTNFEHQSEWNHRACARLLVALLLLLGFRQQAGGSCDVIPGTLRIFRGTTGSLDRPFARPGDFVTVRVSSACAPTSPGIPTSAAAGVVSVVFTPPNDPSANQVVVLSTDCAALESARQTCEQRPDVATATCLNVNGPGDPTGIEVVTIEGERRLRFRFPDTDALFAPDGDDRTFAGPAKIAVTAPGDPLPCGLASQACTALSGLVACVDQLYAIDGTCGPAPHADFTHFTALPPANDYQAVCFDPTPPCLGTAPEFRFTTDRDGNLLLPVDWRGVLLGGAVPIARLVRANATVEAFAGGGSPIRIPGGEFLRSFSPGGGSLPPIFDPQNDPLTVDSMTLFGTADAPETVLRISRRVSPARVCDGGVHDGLACASAQNCPSGTCTTARCADGPNLGQKCSSDADCAGSECGSGLFELRDRYLDGVGPIVVARFDGGVCQAGANEGQACTSDSECGGESCVAYRLAAEDPAPLEGLNQTAQVNGFVLAEAIVGRDLNGDGDSQDSVVVLADRETGAVQPIGAGGFDGRAVVRVRQPPFSFPAVALEGEVLAYLEPETAQGAEDSNGNGQVFDTLLRVHRLGPVDRTPLGPLRAVDAAPLIDGRPLVVSGGKVFVRTAEAALAAQAVERLSDAAGGAQGNAASTYMSVSADGRWAAFESTANNLVPGDTNGHSDVFVRDLVSGDLVRASLSSTGAQATNVSFTPSLSADGRFVAFYSNANVLVPGEFNGASDVFVRDRDADADGIFDESDSGATTTEWISRPSDGFDLFLSTLGDGSAISADGRWVAFLSEVLEPGGSVRHRHVMVRDRLSQTTQRISVDGNGAPLTSDGSSFFESPRVSGDGRYVAFRYAGTGAVPDDTNGRSDVFVRDLLQQTTERASLASDGSQSDGDSIHLAINGDGRYVAFSSWATNLVAGDTNGARDVFVRDRLLGRTERVSLGSAGEQGTGDSEEPSISSDGRYVAFRSVARNLVSDSSHGGSQVYLHDRLTGTTTRVSSTPSGGESAGGSYYVVHTPSVSADGRTVVFNTNAADLVTPDTNTFCDNDPTDGVVHTDENCSDLFVHHADPADPLAADVSGDGALDTTLLEIVDAVTGTLTTVCPASAVSVANGSAAFLRPESAGVTPDLPACPTAALVGGAPDLNGDGDVDDAVVHLWQAPTGAQNLACAATSIWLSATHVAALVPEAAGVEPHNGDADREDAVLVLHDLADSSPTSCADWTPVGASASVARAAGSASLVGTRIAFLSPEADEDADLNHDGDQADLVLQLYDATTATLINTEYAATDFVLGTSLLAFRTAEAAQGGTDLNGDSDDDDDVLFVVDLATGAIIETGQAVVPCQLEACDPRFPYRVLDDTVKFLTFEPDQGEDLNGNGSTTDLILQVFNVRLAQDFGARRRQARTARTEGGVQAQALTVIGVVSSGICTNSATACNADGDCGGGNCFVPPGGCIRDLGNFCNPAGSGSCGPGRFCQPATSTCFEVGAACESDVDCPLPATCSPKPSAYRLLAPLAGTADGGEIFIGAGQCLEPQSGGCAVAADCAVGETCSGGACARLHGPCVRNEDCPADSQCQLQLATTTARDSDHDELADPFDNCPQVPNIHQADGDEDGVGDACVCRALAATTSLTISERVGRSDRGRLKLKAADESLQAPTPGSSGDPRIAGGSLIFSDPLDGEQRSLLLPAGNWIGLGNPAGSKGYAYRDAKAVAGPCTKVRFQLGNKPKLQASCSGVTLPLGEVERERAWLVQLALGDERTCMQARGTIDVSSSGAKYRAAGARPSTWPPR